MLNKKYIQNNSEKCFLGLPNADYKEAKFVILPVPYEETVCYGKGTKNGPEAIIKASSQLEFYNIENKNEPYKQGVCTLKPIKNMQKLYEVYVNLLEDKKRVFLLGGEHSISFWPVKALNNFYNDFTVLHIDAHADLRDEYEGRRDSHACVMKRINEEGIKHVSIGVRSMSKEETSLYVEAADMPPAKMSENVYITFDVDAFDPSIMPAVGTPEPGGLSWQDAMDIFQELKDQGKNIIGFDLVELAPIKGLIYPEFTCAKLIFNAMSYLF